MTIASNLNCDAFLKNEKLKKKKNISEIVIIINWILCLYTGYGNAIKSADFQWQHYCCEITTNIEKFKWTSQIPWMESRWKSAVWLTSKNVRKSPSNVSSTRYNLFGNIMRPIIISTVYIYRQSVFSSCECRKLCDRFICAYSVRVLISISFTGQRIEYKVIQERYWKSNMKSHNHGTGNGYSDSLHNKCVIPYRRPIFFLLIRPKMVNWIEREQDENIWLDNERKERERKRLERTDITVLYTYIGIH